MLNAPRSLDPKVIEVALQRFTSFVLRVELSMVRSITGQTVTITIASLAVVGTVRTERICQSVRREWGQAHHKAKVISADIVLLSARHTIWKVFAGETLRRTARTFWGKVLEVAADRNTSRSRVIELPEIHCSATSETDSAVLACIAVKYAI